MTVQGIVRGLSDYIKIEEMHFTHIRRRILKIKPQLNLGSVDDNKPVTLIVDASGLTALLSVYERNQSNRTYGISKEQNVRNIF
jgi:hypothetical protein